MTRSRAGAARADRSDGQAGAAGAHGRGPGIRLVAVGALRGRSPRPTCRTPPRRSARLDGSGDAATSIRSRPRRRALLAVALAEPAQHAGRGTRHRDGCWTPDGGQTVTSTAGLTHRLVRVARRSGGGGGRAGCGQPRGTERQVNVPDADVVRTDASATTTPGVSLYATEHENVVPTAAGTVAGQDTRVGRPWVSSDALICAETAAVERVVRGGRPAVGAGVAPDDGVVLVGVGRGVGVPDAVGVGVTVGAGVVSVVALGDRVPRSPEADVAPASSPPSTVRTPKTPPAISSTASTTMGSRTFQRDITSHSPRRSAWTTR